jgi:hypothetical protein
MTKSFLEPIVLKPENEKLIREAFSKKNLNKIRESKSQTKQSRLINRTKLERVKAKQSNLD